jgi:hypothetical protein
VRYAAIKIVGSTEISAIEVIVDDLDWAQPGERIRIEGEDSTKVVRQFYYYLMEEGFYKNPRTAQIEGLIFGIVENWEVLMNSRTLHKYIKMEGGLLNPCLFFFDGKKLQTIDQLTKTRGVEAIVELVRRHYQLHCRAIA